MKRAIDIVIATGGLLLVSPVLLVIALAVRLSSQGGALFVHSRIGRYERQFRCFKFRSMAEGAPVAGSHEVAANWVTSVGKVLRKTKLDELPQLINVILGDMSLVGPRPCLPNQADVIKARRKFNVFDVRPGITGLAQLSSIDMSDPERLARIDYQYIVSQSLFGDMKIVLATLLSVVKHMAGI